MPTRRDDNDERARRIDELVQERGRAEALAKQSETLKERARRATRDATAAVDDAARLVPPSRNRER